MIDQRIVEENNRIARKINDQMHEQRMWIVKVGVSLCVLALAIMLILR